MKDEDKKFDGKKRGSKNGKKPRKPNGKKGSDGNPRPEEEGGGYNPRNDSYGKREDAMNCYGKENDPSWYNKLNTLVKDVANVPFTTQLGTAANFNNSYYSNTDFPAVCALYTQPIPGIARSATDGVNLAATGVYQFMRSKLSTVASYAAADVMMYILAIDSILYTYVHIARLFGLVNLYSSLNLNFPNTLFRACGFDTESINDFKNHINDYRSQFNTLIYKASALYLPTDFTITARHTWLFGNVFSDHEDVKGQMYLHVPIAAWRLNETYSQEGTALEMVQIGRSVGTSTGYTATMPGLLTIFDSMVEAIRNSDSMNKIAADMKRAFEGRTQWSFNWIDEKFMISPTKSTEVMSQIENTTILPNAPIWYFNSNADADFKRSWHITQSVDKNTVVFDPIIVNDKTVPSASQVGDLFMANRLVNAHWNDPTNDDVLIMTRNMNFINGPESPFAGTLTSAGSDIVCGCVLFYNKDNPIHSSESDLAALRVEFINSFAGDLASAWSAFDWAPIVYNGFPLPTPDPNEIPWQSGSISPICELDNYTFMSSDLVDKINNMAIMSMWNIPQLGSIQ